MGGSFRGAQSGDEGGFGGFDGGFWVFATRRWLACFPRVFGVFGLVGFALVAGLV